MILWLFAACWCVLLLIHNGGLSGLDGETFYQVAKSAVDEHRLDVGPGFNSTMPFLSGAHMLLLEPSKSVILFVPVTVLLPFALVRLWRRDRQAALLISSTAAITFVVAALWHNPNGGWCWGPRLLIPAIPSTLAVLGPWMDTPLRRMLAIGLFVLGFAVSAPAVAIST